MYKIKKEKVAEFKKYGTIRKLAQATELSENYITLVLNGRRDVAKKVYAYAIVKTISPELEISDLFDVL